MEHDYEAVFRIGTLGPFFFYSGNGGGAGGGRANE